MRQTFIIRFPVQVSVENKHYTVFEHFATVKVEAENIGNALDKLNALLINTQLPETQQ